MSRIVNVGKFRGGAKVRRRAAPVRVIQADGTEYVVPGDKRTYAQRRDGSTSNRYRVTREMKEAVGERDAWMCQVCSTRKGPFHVDHIRPYSKGGWNVLSNLRLLCRDCNLAKGAVWQAPAAPTEAERFRY